MKAKTIIVFLILITYASFGYSQSEYPEFTLTSINTEFNDSTIVEELPILSANIYESEIEMNRNYEYDIINKRRSLIKLSNDLRIVGVVSMFAIVGIISGIGCTHDWNSWLIIGSSVVGGLGIEWMFNRFASNLRKKADAIVINTVPVANIGSKTHLLATTISERGMKISGLGLGLQYDF